MIPLDIFYQHHHCSNPQPESAEPDHFGGIRCVTCSFEIIVASWLEPGIRALMIQEEDQEKNEDKHCSKITIPDLRGIVKFWQLIKRLIPKLSIKALHYFLRGSMRLKLLVLILLMVVGLGAGWWFSPSPKSYDPCIVGGPNACTATFDGHKWHVTVKHRF